MSDFIHLKCHTEYSITDGLLRTKSLLAEVDRQSMPAVAVTDIHNLFSWVKFYQQSQAKGIKAIVGADFRLREGKKLSAVTLLAQNQQGYANLTELISLSYLEGQQHSGVPEINWAWLEQYAEGLIVLSGGRSGDIGQALLQQDSALAEQLWQRWQRCFPQRYYLELVRTERNNEERYLHLAVNFSSQFTIPVVATNDVRFLQQDDFEAHEARVCINSGYQLADPKRPRLYSNQQYFKSAEQMQALFEDIPEAIENTVKIAQRCNVNLELGKVYLPDFPVPDGVSLKDFLHQESMVGLDAYWQGLTSEVEYIYEDYVARLDLELGVINRMGFPGYFLIVADFIRWAKENDIPVGPGRGSGAGSLVAFCLGITTLDPLEHHLLFERFLNPERVSMPDFDVDFCMQRRDEVIEYVAQRYGQQAVSQIITYGTMAAKAVVRDVGRVLGHPYGFVDTLAKLIPFDLGITLEKALQQEPTLKSRYDSEEEVATLIDLAKRLEGVCRNAGKHAGGVVIAPSKLTDFAPLYCEASGEHPVTQFDKDDVEAVGLVKFDFLGLRTLTIIHWALTAINQRMKKEGKDTVNIDQLPLDDEKTFDLLKSCATTAVFQLESRGMKELVKRLQPDSFEEITALVALFRPGPLQSGMVDDFIDRKHGRATVEYPHPELESILDTTYGVILYQEQVMKIAQVLANYTLGGADILRRAMGKKKPEEMAKQRIIFCEGAAARDVDSKVAEHIFDLMEKFAGYGFNKSHSAAYALIAYQTAYLKAHYPAEFMAAVLSSDLDNTDKVVGFLQECRRMGLKVIPPNINRGRFHFFVNEKGEIEYGLGAIKGVGQAACEDIVAQREQQGPYSSLFDFCQRVDMHKLSRRGLEPMIRAGALDDFKQSRAILFATTDKAIQAAEQQRRNAAHGQSDLFAEPGEAATELAHLSYVDVPDWTQLATLQFEKNTLGFYLSGHPFDVYHHETQHFTSHTLVQLQRCVGKTVTIAAIILHSRRLVTKSGRRMAVVTLEDHTAKVELTLFSRVLEQYGEYLQDDAVVVAKAKVEQDKFSAGVRLLAESITPLFEVRNNRVKRLLLKANGQQQVDELLAQLPVVLQPFRGGRCPIVIEYQSQQAKAELKLGEKWQVRPEQELLGQLKHCCGEDRVILEYD